MPAAERVLRLASEVRGHGPRPGPCKRGVSRPHDPRDAKLVREPLRDEERDTEPGRLARAQRRLDALAERARERLAAGDLDAKIGRIDIGTLVTCREEDEVRRRKDV